MMFLLGWLCAYLCELRIEEAINSASWRWGDAAFWALMALGCFLAEIKGAASECTVTIKDTLGRVVKKVG